MSDLRIARECSINKFRSSIIKFEDIRRDSESSPGSASGYVDPVPGSSDPGPSSSDPVPSSSRSQVYSSRSQVSS